MKKIIAKTTIGQEYLYSTRACYGVSNTAANDICKVLNDCNWQLSSGEKWQVYDAGDYEYTYTNAAFQTLKRRKGVVYACYR